MELPGMYLIHYIFIYILNFNGLGRIVYFLNFNNTQLLQVVMPLVQT